MTPEGLHAAVREIAEALPGSEVTHPFGPTWDVLKVRGKVFALLTEEPGRAVAVLKAVPEGSVALRQEFSFITPGYHMNKRHWITVDADPRLSDELLDELVVESYLLVVEKLPKKRRPVDPEVWAAEQFGARMKQ